VGLQKRGKLSVKDMFRGNVKSSEKSAHVYTVKMVTGVNVMVLFVLGPRRVKVLE
jgi:hypothetical protein